MQNSPKVKQMPQPDQQAKTEPTVDAGGQPSPFISVPGLDAMQDVTVKVPEINQVADVAAIQQFDKDTYTAAQDDNLQHDFVHRVLAARQLPNQTPYVPPPIPPAIADRTRLEMEAGRKAVEARAAVDAFRPRPAPQRDPGAMIAVFRPDEFVPDLHPKRNQGLVPTVTSRQT